LKKEETFEKRDVPARMRRAKYSYSNKSVPNDPARILYYRLIENNKALYVPAIYN
jgi:hypothetical protein